MDKAKSSDSESPIPTLPPPPSAKILMLVFCALLGAAAGINLAQSIWRLLDFAGHVSIAVPLGGAMGAVAAMFLATIESPRVLVLMMAIFAGSAAGAVAGKVAWGSYGEIVGQALGGLVGGITWAIWLYRQR